MVARAHTDEVVTFLIGHNEKKAVQSLFREIGHRARIFAIEPSSSLM